MNANDYSLLTVSDTDDVFSCRDSQLMPPRVPNRDA
jgi:hypothetical protein